MDRSDAEGLGRDDPGAVFVQRLTPAAPEQVDDGVEVLQIGPRSTQWYSGRQRRPARCSCPRRAARRRRRRRGARRRDARPAGRRRRDRHAVLGPRARGRGRRRGGRRAAPRDRRRRRHLGPQPQHQLHERLHVQVQVLRVLARARCRSTSAARRTCCTLDDIAERAREAAELGATEVCLQGGIHPDFDGDYYIDVTRAVKEAAPDIHVHGFTALEVTEGARASTSRWPTYLQRLMDAGLRTLPGTAAEILDDEIRAILCPDKINTERVARRPPHRPLGRAALEHHHHVRLGRAARALGPPHRAHPRPAGRDRRLHRVRAAARSCTWPRRIYLQKKARRGPDLPRGRC